MTNEKLKEYAGKKVIAILYSPIVDFERKKVGTITCIENDCYLDANDADYEPTEIKEITFTF